MTDQLFGASFAFSGDFEEHLIDVEGTRVLKAQAEAKGYTVTGDVFRVADDYTYLVTNGSGETAEVPRWVYDTQMKKPPEGASRVRRVTWHAPVRSKELT